MLQTGEADIIDPVPAIDVARIEDDPTIVVDNFPGITYRYVTLNTEMELPGRAENPLPTRESARL